ncbi:MAG: hypothetical protein RRY21_07180, partial [Oscillospiraceae bacterium]
LSGISTSVEEGAQSAIPQALARLALPPEQILSAQLAKASVDARRGQVQFVCSVAVELTEQGAAAWIDRSDPSISIEKPVEWTIRLGERRLTHRPVVIGFGPAGMFSALLLAQNGYRPIVLERGASIDERVRAVEGFWAGQPLDIATNVQFGEGGAGTFSDGKLTTRIHDPLCAYVLRELVRYGAPQDILVRAKPHIGTDRLRDVVKRLREEILRLGGEIRFLTAADHFRAENGALRAIGVLGSELPADAAILAVGHSARDTFEALAACGATILPKAFSVGVRIEHLQAEIDRAMYGVYAGHPNLPHGEYQLSHREAARAAYT